MSQKEKILQVIHQLAKLFSEHQINWLVGGSGGLLVHGLDLVPNDVDLIVDPGDWSKAVGLLAKHLPNLDDALNSTKLAFRLGEIEVEIDKKPIDQEELIKKTQNGVELPLNPLEAEYEYYQKRTDKPEANQRKVKLIKEALGLS